MNCASTMSLKSAGSSGDWPETRAPFLGRFETCPGFGSGMEGDSGLGSPVRWRCWSLPSPSGRLSGKAKLLVQQDALGQSWPGSWQDMFREGIRQVLGENLHSRQGKGGCKWCPRSPSFPGGAAGLAEAGSRNAVSKAWERRGRGWLQPRRLSGAPGGWALPQVLITFCGSGSPVS